MKKSELENSRNQINAALYERVLREALPDANLVVAGAHHIFVRSNGTVDEIPSADTLIFDHVIAYRIWGEGFREVLAQLASTPVPARDMLLEELLNSRKPKE